jgi:hypothetical protein
MVVCLVLDLCNSLVSNVILATSYLMFQKHCLVKNGPIDVVASLSATFSGVVVVVEHLCLCIVTKYSSQNANSKSYEFFWLCH